MFNRYLMLFTTESAFRKRVNRDLIEARNELLSAEANLEHAMAHRTMLVKRVERLEKDVLTIRSKDKKAEAERKAEHAAYLKEQRGPMPVMPACSPPSDKPRAAERLI